METQEIPEETSELNEEEIKNEMQKVLEQNAEPDENETKQGADYGGLEISEIDVLKYKNEQDMNSLRKEYEQQLDLINTRVRNYFFSA